MTATQPPRPAAIGSVELGGLEDNNPATCTYSIGGDVGAGVVSITIGSWSRLWDEGSPGWP